MSKSSSKQPVAVEPFDSRSYNRKACYLTTPVFLKSMVTSEYLIIKAMTGSKLDYNTFLPLN